MIQKHGKYIIAMTVLFCLACDNNPIKISEDNSAPIASFSIKPNSGDVNTVFHFDATSSYDSDDSLSSLFFRWDWENDGTWDTEASIVDTISHQCRSTGEFLVSLEVMESDGLKDTTLNSLIVLEKVDRLIISFVAQLYDAGKALFAAEGYLLLAKNNQLIINDVSSPSLPNELSSIEFQSEVNAAIIFDNGKLLVGADGLKLFNITDGYNPLLIESVSNSAVKTIKLYDEHLDVCFNRSARIYDYQLNRVGYVPSTGNTLRDVVAQDSYAYTGEHWTGLGSYICGYGYNGNREFARSIDGVYQLEICNNHLVVLGGTIPQIRLFNINDPINIAVKDVTSVGWTNNMLVRDDTLFAVGNDGGGVSMFTISDSSNFVLEANSNLMESTSSLAVHANFIYVNPYNSEDLYVFRYDKY